MASTAVASSGFEIWSVPGKPVSVHLRTSIAGRVRQLANESSGSAWETGGVLWGRVRDAGDDHFVVSIEQADILECDHSRGEVWALSDADRKELRKRLKQKNGDLRPVGFWRSHRRPGLYLDKRDFDLMREFFAEPWCVALCASPSGKAGYFLWEEGEIHRTSSYREFELPQIAQPVEAPRRKQPIDRTRWAIAAGIALLALTLFLSRSTTRSVETPFNMLSMHAETKPGTVRLKWNPKSKVLDGAKGVTLWIADGVDESRLELTPDQVRSGVLDYRPINADVNFRIQVGPFSESLRIIRNQQQIAAVTTPSQPATVAPTAVPSPLEPVPPVKPERKSKRSKHPAEQPADPVSETPVRDLPVQRSREVDAPPPPQLALGPTRLDRPPIPNRVPELPKVTATVENPRVSPLKKAFGWMRIPGTNRKDFIPPKAVKQVQPHVYSKEAASVAVRVAIDDRGNVWDADLLTKDIDGQLGLSALEAAKRWRFEPARVEDKPVGSNMVVRFHFGSD